jgi:acetylornithine deacetylase/succinyl-diaminopimelate desuccinylase-like protein
MKENIINKLKELLKYKTIKDNKEEFDKLFTYIKKTTKEDLVIKEYKFNENKCLVISNIDTTNYDIIFCTHIDIVPCSTYDIKEDNENIYGRGTIDMKGSVAVCLELLNNIKTDKKIALFITSDEEVDGNCVYKLLKIYNSKLAIVPRWRNKLYSY